MEALYSTIFVAVLALFGLLVAALIYVAQTVQDRYSTKLAQRLLKGRLSLSFWFFGLLTLLLASLGLFVQAYPADEIVAFGWSLCAVADSPYYGAATLAGVFFVLFFFILTLRSYARLLSPLTVLEEMARALTPYSLRDIALFRLHEEVPVPKIDESELRKLLGEIDGMPEASPETEMKATPPAKANRVGRLMGRFHPLVGSYRMRRPSKVERIKKRLAARDRAGKLEDPFGDLFEYGLSAIAKNNALAWRAFLRRLIEVFRKSGQLGFLADRTEIPFLGEGMLLQGLERLTEEIEIAQRYSLRLELNDAIEEICKVFTSVKSWRRVLPFLTFFQDVGARALARNDALLFRSSVRVLTCIGVVSIKNEPESQVFDDVCRKLGWLGERLILRGIEESPIMPSGNETEELGEITEAIYKLGGSLSEDETDKYPLILRDAIEVICDQALKKNDPRKFEGTILSLLGVHEDLAEGLIRKESENAEAYLWLVLHYFKGILRSYNLSDYRELRKDIFSWVQNLAQEAVGHNQPTTQFWGARIGGARDLCGLIISFMVEMGDPDDWDAPMREVCVKSHKHIDEAWAFVKRAGAELHSNFGMMFDPETGEDYAPNDPRRR
jgi:hypothetical protein